MRSLARRCHVLRAPPAALCNLRPTRGYETREILCRPGRQDHRKESVPGCSTVGVEAILQRPCLPTNPFAVRGSDHQHINRRGESARSSSPANTVAAPRPRHRSAHRPHWRAGTCRTPTPAHGRDRRAYDGSRPARARCRHRGSSYRKVVTTRRRLSIFAAVWMRFRKACYSCSPVRVISSSA